MRLQILAFGQNPAAWVQTGIETFQQRMPRDWSLDIQLLKPEKRLAGKPITQLLALEAERLQTQISKQAAVWCLDERGQQHSTQSLAQALQSQAQQSGALTLCLGSADGLDAGLKAANPCFSLSKLTLPHEIARLVLVEQLYRAVCVIKQHPYHRDTIA
jgi:23S rRNA (pseudouridine1915-N3)-methyltransferase